MRTAPVAQPAGRRLKLLVKDQPLIFFVSPYLRTRQTFKQIEAELEAEQIIKVRHEPRLVEQQFGNFRSVDEVREASAERRNFGKFFFRFSEGESGLDVFNRVTSFIGTMLRDIEHMRRSENELKFGSINRMKQNQVMIPFLLDGDGSVSYEDFVLAEKAEKSEVQHQEVTIVLVIHGLTLRLFLMRWLKLDVEVFENMCDPPNASLVVMESAQDSILREHGSFHLTTESQRLLGWL